MDYTSTTPCICAQSNLLFPWCLYRYKLFQNGKHTSWFTVWWVTEPWRYEINLNTLRKSFIGQHYQTSVQSRNVLFHCIEKSNSGNKSVILKSLDPFGKQCCPRPTLCVPQLLYQITSLWKFGLNRSLESGENNGKTHPFRRVMTCV